MELNTAIFWLVKIAKHVNKVEGTEQLEIKNKINAKTKRKVSLFF